MSDLLTEEIVEFAPAVLEEAVEDGERKYYLKSILAESNCVNANHRVYPKAVLKEAYDNLMETCQNRDSLSFGELGHTSNTVMNFDKVCVSFPQLVWNEEKGTIEGKALILDTTAGHNALGIMKGGIRLGFSTRGTGGVHKYTGPLTEDKNVVEVNPGLKFVSIDLVHMQSAPHATATLCMEDTQQEQEPKEVITGLDIVKSIF